MKWNLISLGDIAVRRGGSVDPKKYASEVFELYSIPAFDAGAPEIVTGSAIGSSKKAVQPNDVMISRIVPHIRRACVVGSSNGHRQIASSEWIIFRDERIWPSYLRWVLVGDVFHSAFMRTVSGVGGSLLRARSAEVFKIQVPLPPLAEQKRIAEILDAADALRTKRREALAKLDTLVQSTFLDMFGDPISNPMEWEAATLSEVTDEIYRYPTYFGIVYEDEGIPEIRGGLIGKGGKIDTNPSELRFISQATSDKFPRTQLALGDLVMSVRGTIGKIGIVPAELANANMTANLIRISPARSIIDPIFLLHVALGPYFINKLSEASSSTTIKTIKALDLKAIPIPLPPLKLQRRFAAIVESIEDHKDRQRAHLTELDTLFASLQSRAFRGDL